MVIIFKIITFLCQTVFMSYVLQRYWEWFIVPIFKIPMLSLAQIYGLYITIALITFKVNAMDILEAFEKCSNNPDEMNEKLSSINFGIAVCVPLFSLLSGWLVQKFFL